jgi:hypothetical protein
MISVKDRRLRQDALDWRCDAFLTMERRLPKAAEFIEQETELGVMRTTTYLGPARSMGQALLLSDELDV